MKSLWEKVQKVNETTKNKEKSPIIEVDVDKKQAHIDMVTRYAKTQSNSSRKSKASSLKELPNFINPEESDKEVLRLPSQYSNPTVMDTANLQILMSTLVKVSMTLAKILKAKPKLWQEITTCMNKMGVPITEVDPIHTEEKV